MKRDTIDPHARWVAGFPAAVEHHCCRQMNECGRTRDWRSKRCPTFVVPLSLSLFRTLSLTAATSSHNINDSQLYPPPPPYLRVRFDGYTRLGRQGRSLMQVGCDSVFPSSTFFPRDRANNCRFLLSFYSLKFVPRELPVLDTTTVRRDYYVICI